MKKFTQVFSIFACIALGCASARAAVQYWDIDGAATAGAGGATPSGTWDTAATANWTTDSTGASASGVWNAADSAVFSAGSDATGAFTVNLNGAQNTVGLNFEEGEVTLSGGTISMTANPFPIVATANATINSVLSGGTLTKTGTGTVTLNGANSYVGTTTVNAGVIAVGNNAALGSAATNTVINSGGAVNIGGGIVLAEPFSLTSPATGVSASGAIRSTGGSNSVDFVNVSGAAGSSARINVDSGTFFVRAVFGPNRNLLTFGGDGDTIISTTTPVTNVDGCLWGGEGGGITKEGNGTLTLNGQFTGRGTITVSGGTFKMGASGRFGNAGPVLPDLVLAGTFDVNGFDNAVDGLSGAGSVINAGTSTLIVCTNPAISSVHVASPNFTGVISGGTTLWKAGPLRTQTLSGNNTYTGNTVVKAGVLKLGATGSISNTPTISINPGAMFDVSLVSGYTLNGNQTLSGNGTVTGAVAVAVGGRVSPGDSAGKLTMVGGLDLSAGGTNVWELASNSTSNPGTDYDQIVLSSGTLALGGASTLSIRFTGAATTPVGSDPFWQTSHSWNIISASGAASNFGAIQNGTYAAGNFTTSVDGTGIVLTFTPAGGPPAAPAPVITSLVNAGTTSVTVNYSNTIAGTNYIVQYRTNLNTTNWSSLAPVTAAGTTSSSTDTPPTGDAQRFYRVYYAAP